MTDTLKNSLLKQTKIIEVISIEECEIYFKELNQRLKNGIFGLDVECTSKGELATIQISNDNDTVIIRFLLIMLDKRISHSTKFVEFVAFLQNDNFIKTGVGILKDAKSIETSMEKLDLKVDIKSCIDLRFLLDKTNLKPTKLKNLACLSKYFLGVTLSESPGRWESTKKLTFDQISYAAADSFFGLQLFYRFWNSSHLNTKHKVICSPLYPDDSSESKDLFYEAANWSRIIEWIGEDMNKQVDIDDGKSVVPINCPFTKKDRKHPKIRHLSRVIINFPNLDKASTLDFEYLETLAQINILTRNATSTEDGEFGRLILQVINFCIAWRWNAETSILNEMLANIKKNAPEIDKQRKIIATKLKDADKIIKDEKIKKYEASLISKNSITMNLK